MVPFVCAWVIYLRRNQSLINNASLFSNRLVNAHCERDFMLENPESHAKSKPVSVRYDTCRETKQMLNNQRQILHCLSTMIDCFDRTEWTRANINYNTSNLDQRTDSD